MKKTMILAVFLAVKSQKFLFFRDPDIFFKMGGVMKSSRLRKLFNS